MRPGSAFEVAPEGKVVALAGDGAGKHADDGLATFVLDELFAPSRGARVSDVVTSRDFRRRRCDIADGTQFLLDEFPDVDGLACCFVRLAAGEARNVRFSLRGVERIEPCGAGGWLLVHSSAGSDAYWMPQPAALRRVDGNGRILSQSTLWPVAVASAGGALAIEFRVPAGEHLDLALWRVAAMAQDVRRTLAQPSALERQGWFVRSSHATMRMPGDVFSCLVHGHVYDNRFVWRRIWGGYRWRIASENEAHSLYVTLRGLALATGGRLPALVARQLAYSVLSRQAADGGWYHGEWTDRMESHFRLHNAGVQLLAAAFEERRDPVLGDALAKAAAFSAGRTGNTDLGLWFLHDSLEESVEAATAKEAPPWDPVALLGASSTNKLILNTHLDAIVTLDRYRAVTHDARHQAAVDSAVGAARGVLALRPAEALYRLAYRAVRTTLVAPSAAKGSSLARRVVRRLARDYVVPNLYRLRRRHPRLVMPGGLLDRHLAPRHFDMGYHPVNLMDLVRLWRRFPGEDFRAIVDGAVEAVTETGLLQYWVESKHRQPVGYWVEALYHLATLDPASRYRRHLAEAILAAEDAELGLPPTVLGTDPEAVAPEIQVPCPSPADARLRVANLGRKGRQEVLVVNPGAEPLPLAWERPPSAELEWEGSQVPARGWLVGLESGARTPPAATSGFGT